MAERRTHGSPELDADAAKLEALGADPGPTLDDFDLDDDGWCIDCGDPFHYDDMGGYNPPCSCGFHCRSCHEAAQRDVDDDDDFPTPAGDGR